MLATAPPLDVDKKQHDLISPQYDRELWGIFAYPIAASLAPAKRKTTTSHFHNLNQPCK
jgi:hypothetical protein